MAKNKKNKRLKEDLLELELKYRQSNEDKLTFANVLSTINGELQESLDNEKRFIASVSHELRTPMTSIIGYGELMSDTKLNSTQKRYLKSITQSSNYLLSLVNDLLDVAKFKDKRVELTPKVIEFADITSECITLMESKIAEGVELKVNLPLLDYKIKADDKRLKQIILNLLSNAAKFTKKGSIHFYADPVKECINNQIEFTLHVKDTGMGIPEEVKETLFEPFSSTDKTQGTGLGLFISKELAELMEGSISVDTVNGAGSHFTLKFMVEKSIKKELGKGLIGSRILMCSEKNIFLKSIIEKLEQMQMHSFEHYDTSSSNISSLVTEFIPLAKNYDIAIFDLTTFAENAPYIAKMFSIVNPNIKLIGYLKNENLGELSHFNLLIPEVIGYQKFITKVEKLYLQDERKILLKNDYLNLNILLVEDVEVNRIYEVEMLKNFFGITCDIAENGAIAVKKAKEQSYDAILMDVRMPVMNGLIATQKIREFNQDVPIICMSANVYKEDKIAAEEAGMNDFIEKPLERVDIENKLVKLLEHGFGKYIKEKINYKQIVKDNLRENFDETIAKQLCIAAMKSISEGLENINTHTKEKNLSSLTEEFHRLKGVLLNLGLTDFAEQASSLQKYAQDEDMLALDEYKDNFTNTMLELLEEKE